MIKRKLALLFLITLAYSAVYAQSPRERTRAELVRRAGFRPLGQTVQALDFRLRDLGGSQTTLATYAGRVVFLNFWASWCPSCRAEKPAMENLYREFKDHGLVIVAVNLQEDSRTVGGFVRRNGLSFPVLLDTTGSLGAAYGVSSIPTSLLIDGRGRIIGTLVGTREWDTAEIRSAFKSLLTHERIP